ncbi:MAG TPA: DUF3090 family protein [Thermomicrobiales bacterium]|nr:DUF3090 family protein [Thermomicrobiales bacterium]
MDDGSNEIEALDVQYIRPEAIGEPGARRFRIVTVINGRTVIAWMEKEQVRQLGELLVDIVQRLGFDPAGNGEQESGIVPEEATPDQFRAGRLELSYDGEDDRLVVIMHDIEADDDAAPALAFRLSRAQAVRFNEDADTLIHAGRPLCPLCGRPMGPGNHVCEKQNGHLPHN